MHCYFYFKVYSNFVIIHHDTRNQSNYELMALAHCEIFIDYSGPNKYRVCFNFIVHANALHTNMESKIIGTAHRWFVLGTVLTSVPRPVRDALIGNKSSFRDY